MIGIRREDKNNFERRAPLTPEHVGKLVARGIEVVVAPSEKRVFSNEAYRAAGATVQEDLSACKVIFGVKEMPDRRFAEGRAYVFFAHVIKGQPENMAMLDRLLELNCTLIDYEKVTDDAGRRLVFFGKQAGWAGMIDCLWALGRRLEVEGFDTPLRTIRQALEYENLAEALEAIEAVGQAIASDGLPEAVSPVTVGFAGYGNVSAGAQEVLARLPILQVGPDDLPAAAASGDRHRVVKVVFREEHMVVPLKRWGTFELQDYYDHPERYRGNFARHVPYLTILVNCIYWTSRYPRLISRDLLHGLYGAGQVPRLRVIGDLSCDIKGGIECTVRPTDSGDPVYVYSPADDRARTGVEGHGPIVLAVDNLPCELPLEASRDFSDALFPLVEHIARADFGVPYGELMLPSRIKRAIIAHRGELTPDFRYLQRHLGD